MRRERNDFKYLWDMQDAGRNAVEFSRGQSRESLDRDRLFRSALERALQVVGEASRCVSDEFKGSHPEFGWEQFATAREMLVDISADVDSEILWRVATQHLPGILVRIDAILKANAPESCSG